MSRIGKLPIQVPAGVTITVDNGIVSVVGPKGTLSQTILPNVTVTLEESVLKVTRNSDEKIARAEHGLMRALINNLVIGVTQGFEKKLELNGVGFRVSGGGKAITMALGFSHPVEYKSHEAVELKVEKNLITVSGINKQQVGQVAAEIRSLKKPEPYKGKGIKYIDEQIVRKAGKTGAK
ncbi:MAG TPA: 50S ribosomal protein L6 [Patescibacteria group bacterium]|jgi:large subunit ribosomal protein L6|nr:50S ribosomal protein L6 [Patescibacteria group bacterium]